MYILGVAYDSWEPSGSLDVLIPRYSVFLGVGDRGYMFLGIYVCAWVCMCVCVCVCIPRCMLFLGVCVFLGVFLEVSLRVVYIPGFVYS